MELHQQFVRVVNRLGIESKWFRLICVGRPGKLGGASSVLWTSIVVAGVEAMGSLSSISWITRMTAALLRKCARCG